MKENDVLDDLIVSEEGSNKSKPTNSLRSS